MKKGDSLGGHGGLRKSNGLGITLDLRSYNPLTAHLLTQSYVYPASNGLTQTDRGKVLFALARGIECFVTCRKRQKSS